MRAAAALALSLLLASCGEEAPPPARPTGMILVYDGGAGASDPKGPGPTDRYAYVAVRSFSAIGLAEARGMTDETARAVVSRLADALEVCVTDLGAKNALTPGAARVVVLVGPDGSVSGTKVVPDPPTAPVLATAKLCIEARARLVSFPPGDGDKRGMAIEAMWGTLMAKPKE